MMRVIQHFKGIVMMIMAGIMTCMTAFSSLASTGWVKDNDNWYYYYPDGTMATGLVQVDGTYYYLKDDGTMLTGWIDSTSGSTCTPSTTTVSYPGAVMEIS